MPIANEEVAASSQQQWVAVYLEGTTGSGIITNCGHMYTEPNTVCSNVYLQSYNRRPKTLTVAHACTLMQTQCVYVL